MAADASYQIDESQAPVRIGETNTFRYWFTGTYDPAKAPMIAPPKLARSCGPPARLAGRNQTSMPAAPLLGSSGIA